MKNNILHITTEITKKNFSISSLLDFIVRSNINKKFHKLYILLNKTDGIFLKKYNEKKILTINWLNFFKLKKYLKKYIDNNYIFHVHGIWAPIQLYSLIIISLYNGRLIIHSHGMLLKPAVNKNTLYKKFFKIFTIYLLNFFLSKKTIFIAITKQEIQSIKFYFPNYPVVHVPNPIPFEEYNFIFNKKNFLYKKNFVFFGRIHPHKNIMLLINSFIKANLPNNFFLHIYGIPDDNNYLIRLKRRILGIKNIKIKKPVFNENKRMIMSQSWANLLFSKSEVLSFSILESGSYGLPSLINKQIEVIKNDKFTIRIKNEKDIISKKIKEVAGWSLNFRNFLSKKLLKFYKDYRVSNNSAFIERLNIIYKKVNKTKDESYNIHLLKKFTLTSLLYSFNLFIPSLILLGFFFSNNSILTSDIALINGIFLGLTQIFSSNVRAIAVKKKDVFLLQRVFFYRSIISILLFLIFLFLNDRYFNFLYSNFVAYVVLIILLQWILETKIAIYEIESKIFNQLFYLFFYFISFICFISLLVVKNLYFLNFFLVSFVIILSLLCLSSINIKSFQYNKNFLSKYNYSQNLFPFLSSFSLIFTNVIWRVFIYITYTKDIAAVLFVAFSIGSFPGTLFNSILGPAYIKNKIKLSTNIKIFITIFFIAIILLNIRNYVVNESYFYKVLCLSILGSFFMIKSIRNRYDLFFKKNITLNKIFIKDIYCAIIIMFIVPVFSFLGGTLLVSFSFLFSSLVSLFIYRKTIK